MFSTMVSTILQEDVRARSAVRCPRSSRWRRRRLPRPRSAPSPGGMVTARTRRPFDALHAVRGLQHRRRQIESSTLAEHAARRFNLFDRRLRGQAKFRRLLDQPPLVIGGIDEVDPDGVGERWRGARADGQHHAPGDLVPLVVGPAIVTAISWRTLGTTSRSRRTTRSRCSRWSLRSVCKRGYREDGSAPVIGTLRRHRPSASPPRPS